MLSRFSLCGLAAAALLAVPAQAQAPDGTAGNPPGTAAGRALDRAAGTNSSGAYPSRSDGTAANPRGTAAGRAADRAANGTARSRDGATRPQGTTRRRDASDPPGTAAGRAVDRAAGTNSSGAYPSQSDGTAANPSGTAAGRAADRATR